MDSNMVSETQSFHELEAIDFTVCGLLMLPCFAPFAFALCLWNISV